MKRFTFISTMTILVLLGAMICLSSCSKTERQEKQITGKWEISSMTINGEKEKVRNFYITFKDNGKVYGDWEYEGLDAEAKWYINDDELTIKGGDLDDVYYLWKKESKYHDESLIIKVDIEELSKNTLEVSGYMYWYEDEELDWKDKISVSLERY